GEWPITMTNGTTAVDETIMGPESKKIVESLFFALPSIPVLDKYFATDFIEHHPSNGLLNTLTHLVKVHRVVVEGDFVVAHCELSKPDKRISHFSIFRIARGKIAEHWSVEQEVPEAVAHDNGMF
ncbi:MAG: hypothetical protein M3N14_06515, partial [Bacteroidota bacterium]|nr:hypothetical protein [Bacteroidota bacterium]